MRSTTETLIAAMRILARDIQSGDGVANAAISEAADRLEEQRARIAELEAQAAVGERAVEMLRRLLEKFPEMQHCGECNFPLGVRSELSEILRDAGGEK